MALSDPFQTEVNYIYCIQLPGFECLSDSQKAPEYNVLKVGHSKNPAHRICSEIMKGFEEFGAQDTRFLQLRDGDTPDIAVEKSRNEPKVVFIRKCRAYNEAEIEAIEEKIRKHIGHLCIPDFQQFRSRIDRDKQQHLERVGMTEWILMSTGLVECIKNQFQRRWIAHSIYETEKGYGLPPTGEQFLRQLCQVQCDYDREHQKEHQVVHQVKITFKPTDFTYFITISPPYVE